MSATDNPAAQATNPSFWPLLPTETEIYILPNGEVVFADLPVELARLAADLGISETPAHFPNPSPPNEDP